MEVGYVHIGSGAHGRQIPLELKLQVVLSFLTDSNSHSGVLYMSVIVS